MFLKADMNASNKSYYNFSYGNNIGSSYYSVLRKLLLFTSGFSSCRITKFAVMLITTKIKKSRLRWFGHVEQIDDND